MNTNNRIYYESKGLPAFATVANLIFGGILTVLGIFGFMTYTSQEKEMKFLYQMGLSDENPEMMIPFALILMALGLVSLYAAWKTREVYIRVADSGVEGLSTSYGFLLGIASVRYSKIWLSEISTVRKVRKNEISIITSGKPQTFYVQDTDQAIYAVNQAIESFRSGKTSEVNVPERTIYTPPHELNPGIEPDIRTVPAEPLRPGSPWKKAGDL